MQFLCMPSRFVCCRKRTGFGFKAGVRPLLLWGVCMRNGAHLISAFAVVLWREPWFGVRKNAVYFFALRFCSFSRFAMKAVAATRTSPAQVSAPAAGKAGR